MTRLDLNAAPARYRSRQLPQLLAAIAILAQISYPLMPSAQLHRLSIAVVLTFFAASLSHAIFALGGLPAARIFIQISGISFLAELIGVHTGWPFGRYAYSDNLGPSAFAVPLLIPLAWSMMGYPCLILARRLVSRPRGGGTRAVKSDRRASLKLCLLGACAMTSWDIFLDPQMVAAGNWTWAHPEIQLPGVTGIPLTNYGGWLLTAFLIMAACQRQLLHLPDTFSARTELVPAALLLWTWLGSTVGNLVFFHRPAVALWGGALLGSLVLSYLHSLWQELQEDS